MATAYVDIDFDEAFSGLSSVEKKEFLDFWCQDYGWEPELTGLDDPAKLLEVIVELRKRGYSVELKA